MESRDILSRLNTSVCLRERLAAILGAVGVAVTDQEIFDIENQRNESLRSHGLLELDSRALEMLLTSIGQAPVFPYYYAAETVCELIELYDEFSTGWDGEEWGADYDK